MARCCSGVVADVGSKQDCIGGFSGELGMTEGHEGKGGRW